jgi:ABC-type dipeptide/oligopeptide/nickel transport system ATPase subunit
MKEAGTSILLVEQNVERAPSISVRAYIMDQGQIVHQASATSLRNDVEIQEHSKKTVGPKHSPEYQEIIPGRLQSLTSVLTILEGA